MPEAVGLDLPAQDAALAGDTEDLLVLGGDHDHRPRLPGGVRVEQGHPPAGAALGLVGEADLPQHLPGPQIAAVDDVLGGGEEEEVADGDLLALELGEAGIGLPQRPARVGVDGAQPALRRLVGVAVQAGDEQADAGHEAVGRVAQVALQDLGGRELAGHGSLRLAADGSRMTLGRVRDYSPAMGGAGPCVMAS